MHVHPVASSCTFLCASERNNLLILLRSITAIKNALKCIRLTLRGTLGTLFPPHKCFSYCPFVPLQNGVDACETERDTRGPRVHYSPLFSRGEWKITPLCLGRKSLPLTSWLRSVMSKGPRFVRCSHTHSVVEPPWNPTRVPRPCVRERERGEGEKKKQKKTAPCKQMFGSHIVYHTNWILAAHRIFFFFSSTSK